MGSEMCIRDRVTLLGVALAARAIRCHIHLFRHSFPADASGPFQGQDLRVFRFLGAVPSTVRVIQRHLHGATKASCLQSLRRAVTAGLAIEPEPERFIAMPPPGQNLSDFILERSPPKAFQTADHGLFPDITDKITPSIELDHG